MIALLEGRDFVGSAAHTSRVKRKQKLAIHHLPPDKWIQQREAEIATATAKDTGVDQPLPTGPRTPYESSSALRAYLHCGCRYPTGGAPATGAETARPNDCEMTIAISAGLRSNISLCANILLITGDGSRWEALDLFPSADNIGP
jgi:hypothetical protein